MAVRSGATAFYLISDGYELPSDGRQKVFPNGTLTISTASKSADEGYYTCTAFNRRDESDSGNVHIQVTSKNSKKNCSLYSLQKRDKPTKFGIHSHALTN